MPEEDEPRWYSVGDDTPEPPEPGPAAPGFHFTITPPPAVQPVNSREAERRARARRWLLAHGAAAGVGRAFGLKAAMTAFLDSTGGGAAAAGLALAGMSWLAAEFVGERYARILPRRLRPAATWLLRIPFATALLATALHAPSALR